jgi:hypothetical protein
MTNFATAFLSQGFGACLVSFRGCSGEENRCVYGVCIVCSVLCDVCVCVCVGVCTVCFVGVGVCVFDHFIRDSIPPHCPSLPPYPHSIPLRTPGAYHLGFTADVNQLVSILHARHPEKKIYLCGFSLGGNAVSTIVRTVPQYPLQPRVLKPNYAFLPTIYHQTPQPPLSHLPLPSLSHPLSHPPTLPDIEIPRGTRCGRRGQGGVRSSRSMCAFLPHCMSAQTRRGL